MKKKILVISKGVAHPTLCCRKLFRRMLLSYENFECTFKDKLEDILVLNEEDTYDGLVLYFHEKILKPEILDAILNHTRQKKGILFIHGAMASFKTNEQYQNIAGGKFKGHGLIKDIAVTDKQNNFVFNVSDELYIHDYDETNHIHLYGKQKGIIEPVLWTRKYEDANVAYFSLGHMSKTFKNEYVKKLVGNLLTFITDHEYVYSED